MTSQEAWDGIATLSDDVAIRMTSRLEEWVALVRIILFPAWPFELRLADMSGTSFLQRALQKVVPQPALEAIL
jgi:hypothetical protein